MGWVIDIRSGLQESRLPNSFKCSIRSWFFSLCFWRELICDRRRRDSMSWACCPLGLSGALQGPSSGVLFDMVLLLEGPSVYFASSFFTLVKDFIVNGWFVGESAYTSLLLWKVYPPLTACFLFWAGCGLRFHVLSPSQVAFFLFFFQAADRALHSTAAVSQLLPDSLACPNRLALLGLWGWICVVLGDICFPGRDRPENTPCLCGALNSTVRSADGFLVVSVYVDFSVSSSCVLVVRSHLSLLPSFPVLLCLWKFLSDSWLFTGIFWTVPFPTGLVAQIL